MRRLLLLPLLGLVACGGGADGDGPAARTSPPPEPGRLLGAPLLAAEDRRDLEVVHARALQAGRDVRVTLDPVLQRAARRALRGRDGSAVAVDARSGRVLAWAGDPDDELVPPGSTLKAVYGAAAVDLGLEAALDGRRAPAGVPDVGEGARGPQTLTGALARSVNTAFAALQVELGRTRVLARLRRAGLLAAASGELRARRPRVPALPAEGYVDLDERLEVSVANLAGVAMALRDGTRRPLRLTDAAPPGAPVRAWSARAASRVRAGLREAVRSGTAASLREVPDVLAKTGTARRRDGRLQGSMVALLGGRVAIAVSVTGDAGFGDDLAGPVVRAIATAR